MAGRKEGGPRHFADRRTGFKPKRIGGAACPPLTTVDNDAMTKEIASWKARPVWDAVLCNAEMSNHWFGDGVEEMAEAEQTFRRKVRTVFAELVADRAANLGRNSAQDVISAALANELGVDHAADVGFHLSDWREEAAFLVALHLFPDRFTVEEIRDGVTALLIHAPNHIAAAAHLAGWPLHDVFKVGLRVGD